MNAFAFDFFRIAGHAESNFAQSPVSIAVALHMLAHGAREKSREELGRVLHVSDVDAAELAPLLSSIAQNAKHDEHQLAFANRLFPRIGVQLQPSFTDVMRQRYMAALEPLDFDTPAATARINGWVSEQTHDKIPEVIPAPLDADTLLVLVNAVYFKAKWAQQFDPTKTVDGAFLAHGRSEVKVPLMHQMGTFSTAEADGVRMLELPYAGGSFALDVVLPARPDGLAALEKSLTAERFQALVGKLAPSRNLSVTLPRFKLKGATQNLNPKLIQLGMPTLFTPKADLSGIGGVPGQLYVSDVFHNAMVEVNEEGSEAAAATAVVIIERASRPEAFEATRPFLFAIRDTKSGAVLFLGHVVDPRAGS